jgi:hypothetical protein
MLYGRNTDFLPLILFVVVLALLIGLRPHSGRWFGDTANYKWGYERYMYGELAYDPDSKEWAFSLLQAVCSQIMPYEWFLVLDDALYFGLMLVASLLLFKNNTWGSMLFLLSAFSTFSYATNGIRNGLACSMILLALSFAVEKKKIDLVIAGLICFVAMAIHKSTTLPVLCFVTAYFFRSTKMAIAFWLFSILLNIGAHGAIESFFSGLGFDDRLSSYINSADEYAQEYKSGFRPDFLLYGAMPIWLAYYVLVKRRIQDQTYALIANTYIYANSFWVMLMQASYSNRFAYLSWFMLPVVLAYPCLKIDVWGRRQGHMAALIMLLHTGFTFFMSFVYY